MGEETLINQFVYLCYGGTWYLKSDGLLTNKRIMFPEDIFLDKCTCIKPVRCSLPLHINMHDN